jgi:putative ABC transport system substrate-binding protein
VAGVGVTLAAPLGAGAQQVGKVPRIGVLGNQPNPPWDAFRQGLSELGYVEGRNVVIEWRWAAGRNERHAANVAELIQLKSDIIVASGTAAALAATRATSTTPIVTTTVGDPVSMGLASSLSRPGRNLTGLVNVAPELGSKRLQILKEIAPYTSRVTAFVDPTSVIEVRSTESLQRAATSLGMTLVTVETRQAADFEQTLASIGKERSHAMFVGDTPMNFLHRQLITELALKHHVVGVYGERLFVESGGLVSYAASYNDLYRRAASYVHKILNGARPADLPMEQPTKFELIINIKTAKTLGLTIPPSLLLRADQVIE